MFRVLLRRTSSRSFCISFSLLIVPKLWLQLDKIDSKITVSIIYPKPFPTYTSITDYIPLFIKYNHPWGLNIPLVFFIRFLRASALDSPSRLPSRTCLEFLFSILILGILFLKYLYFLNQIRLRSITISSDQLTFKLYLAYT